MFTFNFLLLVSCQEQQTASDNLEVHEQVTTVEAESCGEPKDTQVAVITSLDFARRDDDGRSVGFDLDNHASDAGDQGGCGLEDISSPDGEAGIDSAFSGILPILESTQAVAINGLIEDSIRNGELLIMLELTRVSDLTADSCVDFSLSRGEGTPFIGTDGEILADQSFARMSVEPALVENVALTNGSFVAAPFFYRLSLQVLDVFVNFRMEQTHLFAEFQPDGSVSGYFGGAVPLEDFQVITELNDIGDVDDLLESMLGFAADIDLDADGTCDAISIVFAFEGVNAFFFAEQSN